MASQCSPLEELRSNGLQVTVTGRASVLVRPASLEVAKAQLATSPVSKACALG